MSPIIDQPGPPERSDPKWSDFVRIHRQLHESRPDLSEQEEEVFLATISFREPIDDADRVAALEEALAAISQQGSGLNHR